MALLSGEFTPSSEQVNSLYAMIVKEKLKTYGNSYYSKCLSFVRQRRVFVLRNGDTVVVHVPDDQLEVVENKVFATMKRWLVSFRLKLRGEFPHFELLQQFAVFRVLPPSARQAMRHILHDTYDKSNLQFSS